MERRRQRTHLGVRVERVAEADRTGEGDEAVEELVGDRLVEDQPAAGDARLALIVEDGERGSVDGGGEVGVGEHDVGALAAELELDALEVACRVLDDAPSDGGRAGEGDLGDPVVGGDRLAGGVAVTRDDVDDAGWETDIDDQLGEAQGAERGDLAGLHHRGVAGGEGRPELPRAEHQREVPRHDGPDDAERFAGHVVEESRVDGDDVALAPCRRSRRSSGSTPPCAGRRGRASRGSDDRCCGSPVWRARRRWPRWRRRGGAAGGPVRRRPAHARREGRRGRRPPPGRRRQHGPRRRRRSPSSRADR